MGVFNRKVTIYLNDGISLEEVADFAESTVVTGEWLLEEERGSYIRYCQCGSVDCTNAEVL